MVRSLIDDGLDDGDRKLLADIDRVGWHVVLIPEESGTPGWTFSVGLFQTFGHPEIVVFGLPLEFSYRVVNGIGADVKKGVTFESGQEYPEILEGVRCAFRAVLPHWYEPFLGYANWYYRGFEFPVVQCIWPDKKQHFPWEQGFKKAWREAQPLLYEAEPETARVVRLLASMDEE